MVWECVQKEIHSKSDAHGHGAQFNSKGSRWQNTTASLAMDHSHRWNGGLMMTTQTAKPFGRGKAIGVHGYYKKM